MDSNDSDSLSEAQNTKISEESVAPEAEDMRAHENPWEVVEEVPSQAPTPAPDTLSTEPNELENLDNFEDNSATAMEEEPVPMSQAHDYAQQHLEQFEEPQAHSAPAQREDQYFQYPNSPRRRIPYLLIAGILLGLIGIAVIAKVVLFKGSSSESTPSAADILIESSPTPTPSPAASPQIAATDVDKTSLKMQILNGSGVTGAAGKVAEVLKKAGYKNIDTANAATYDAQGIKIQVKDGKTSLGELIKKDLADDYEDITVKDTLDEDSKYDVIITRGKQGTDPSPTPTPSPSPTPSGNVEGAHTSTELKQTSDKKQ